MSDPRLHILHLSSPALPVGAYAYSQGLEWAVVLVEVEEVRGVVVVAQVLRIDQVVIPQQI